MNRKESKPFEKGAGLGDQPQLLKRSSTRSYTKLYEQQKQGTLGRQSITDAFFANDSPELTEMPKRGPSYFMGNSGINTGNSAF